MSSLFWLYSGWKYDLRVACDDSAQLIPHMKSSGKGSILLSGATAALRGSARFSCLSPGENADLKCLE